MLCPEFGMSIHSAPQSERCPGPIFLCLRSKPSEEGPSSGKGVPKGPACGLLGEALEEDTAPGAEAAVPERLPHVVVPHELLVVVLNGGTPEPRG